MKLRSLEQEITKLTEKANSQWSFGSQNNGFNSHTQCLESRWLTHLLNVETQPEWQFNLQVYSIQYSDLSYLWE